MLQSVAFALAALATPAPAPSALSPAERIVGPLREIGHVRAHTAFCSQFAAGAQPAVSSALDYEVRLTQTVEDLRNVDLDDELVKFRTLRVVEADLDALAASVASGRAELRRLRTLADASGAPRRTAVRAFVDALDGAKSRQLEMARKLSAMYGAVADHPVYSLMQTAADARSPAGGPADAAGLSDWLMTDESREHHARTQRLFAASTDDELVGRDLERAGTAGKQALVLGGC